MASNAQLKNWIQSTKKGWGLITQLAVFVCGVISGFLIPPPGWISARGHQTVVRLAQFIVAVLVGLIFLLIQKWNHRKDVERWTIFAVVSLAASLLTFSAYQHLLDTRTCQYASQPVVIGKQYTEAGLTYLNRNPTSTCTSLLEDFAGKEEEVWTRESIDKSRYLLAAVYILNMPLFTMCIIAVVQALSCSQMRRQHRKTRRAPTDSSQSK